MFPYLSPTYILLLTYITKSLYMTGTYLLFKPLYGTTKYDANHGKIVTTFNHAVNVLSIYSYTGSLFLSLSDS